MLNSTPFFTRNLLIWNGIAFIFINILLFILAGEKGVFHAFQFLGLSRPAFLEGALWQPVTSMFIHGGFAHLLMNMLGLWSIGSLLERNLGGKNFLKLYLFSGLIGATFVILFQNSAMPTVGASGAITGLLGALAILYPETTLLLFIFPVKARTAAILLGVVSFIFAFDPSGQISHLGHLGGLIGGVLFAKWQLSKVSYPTYEAQSDFYRDEYERPFLGEKVYRENSKPTIYYDPYRGKFFIRM